MSSILVRIEQDVLDFLKTAGKVFMPIALTAVQAAVAAAKATPIAQMAEAAIQLVAMATLSGADKHEAVVRLLAPVAPTLIKDAGLPVVERSVDDFLRELVQSKFNDLAATGTLAVAKAVVGTTEKLAPAN